MCVMADKRKKEGVSDTLGNNELELDYDMEELEAGISATEAEKTEEVVRRVLDEKLTGYMDAFMEKMLSKIASVTGGVG